MNLLGKNKRPAPQQAVDKLIQEINRIRDNIIAEQRAGYENLIVLHNKVSEVVLEMHDALSSSMAKIADLEARLKRLESEKP